MNTTCAAERSRKRKVAASPSSHGLPYPVGTPASGLASGTSRYLASDTITSAG